MLRKIELYLKDIIRGERKGIIAFFIKLILLPLSWFFGLGVRLRNHLYEQGWMRRYVPPVPLVISIGNIVAGGTGKTPVTLMLARAFYERYTIAILSRGYRSKAEKLPEPVLLSEGEGPTLPASFCGDEPYLFAQRLPKAMVIVGGNRRKASFLAARAGVQAIFLDDGMQHRRLARDFDVVVIDVGDPFGQGYFLPRGFLREDIHSLARANLIILNHIQDENQFTSAKETLKPYCQAPMMGTKGIVAAFRDLSGQECLVQKKGNAALFCAIAHPEYFRRTVEQEGFNIVNELVLADHDSFRLKDLERFAQESKKKGAEWLICTEKDKVKLQDNLILPLPVLWVQMELCIVAGQDEWENFLRLAESRIK